MDGDKWNNASSAGNTCMLQDSYCSLRGLNHALDGLNDVCLLWDTSCTGIRTSAGSKWFQEKKATYLTHNKCFLDPSPDCTTSNPPGRMSVFSEAKYWMRSPQCLSLLHELFYDPSHEAWWQNYIAANHTCCNLCQINVDFVEVYYWPDPHADTSCHSVVGDEISRFDAGATTDGKGVVYWGCTSWLSPNELAKPRASTIITTATLTSTANMEFKYYFYNPWDQSPCGNQSISTLPNIVSPTEHSQAASLHPRGHTLLAESNASTAVLDGYTL